jgi:uncharacterized protein YrrD
MSEPMKVFCWDGQAGWLKEIIIDQDGGRPIKLRMQHLNDINSDVLISIALVTDIGSEEIRLKISLEELEVLRNSQRKETKAKGVQQGTNPATSIN